MGYWKEHQTEIEARGYGDTDKDVCAGCIGDKYISDKIKYSHRSGRCSFCGSYRNVLPLEEILGIIAPVIRREYAPALGEVPWDSETKGYMEPVLDPYDFVHDELNVHLKVTDDKLLQELVDVLTFEDRVSAYRFSKRPHEVDLAAWNEYCDLVNGTPLSAEQIIAMDGKKGMPKDISAILGTLRMVYTHCKKMRMVRILYGESSQFKAHDIYRCVNYLPDKPPYLGLEFIPALLVGTAPAKNVADNRMSEAGDMVFYGADCKTTAMMEVGRAEDTDDHPDRHNNPATIGKFHPNKKFKVLDLTGVLDWQLPSIFDMEHEERRNCWLFLKEFAALVSEVKKDSYKPTQVLTKYIQRKTDLQGIMYSSSKVLGGKGNNRTCYALFVTNRNCIDVDGARDSQRNQLIMESVEQVDFSSVGV